MKKSEAKNMCYTSLGEWALKNTDVIINKKNIVDHLCYEAKNFEWDNVKYLIDMITMDKNAQFFDDIDYEPFHTQEELYYFLLEKGCFTNDYNLKNYRTKTWCDYYIENHLDPRDYSDLNELSSHLVDIYDGDDYIGTLIYNNYKTQGSDYGEIDVACLKNKVILTLVNQFNEKTLTYTQSYPKVFEEIIDALNK